ncbi:MAG TPA: hypothetical protein PLL64_03940 [Rhodothermales bacterium]|nr:hypothetical protein [Rhodothermales bacterium]HRR07538.1 hypothetical protein [Rhodothermales bacterium]
MKKRLFLFMLLLAPITYAQRGGGAPPDSATVVQRALEQAEQMKTNLALTPEQATACQNILKNAALERWTLMKNGFGGPGMREAFQEMREKTNTALSKVLTEQQMTKYREMLQEMRGQGGGRRGGQ